MERKLFAVISENGEVIGSAPFDARTTREAEEEVVSTLIGQPTRKILSLLGWKITPLTEDLDLQYRLKESDSRDKQTEGRQLSGRKMLEFKLVEKTSDSESDMYIADFANHSIFLEEVSLNRWKVSIEDSLSGTPVLVNFTDGNMDSAKEFAVRVMREKLKEYIRILEGRPKITQIIFSPNGDLVGLSESGDIYLWTKIGREWMPWRPC